VEKKNEIPVKMSDCVICKFMHCQINEELMTIMIKMGEESWACVYIVSMGLILWPLVKLEC
jgi:hypothetical protein